MTSLNIDEYEKVEHLKYRGVSVIGTNDRSIVINERIQAGDRTYWKYNHFLKENKLTQNTKLKIYRAAIRPVIT